MRRLAVCVCSVLSVLLFCCVGSSRLFVLKASASVIDPPHTLTVQETLLILGNQIPAKFYYNGNYVDADFTYWGTQSVAEIKSGADLPLSVGTECLVFVTTQQATANPDYITVQLQPEYSIFDCTALHTTVCLMSNSAVSAQAYASPSWLWFLSGYGDYIAGNTFSDQNGDRRCVRFVQGSANQWATAVAIDYHSQSTFQGYSKRVSFYGNTQTNYSDSRYRLYISPFVMSADGSVSSGTFSVTSGGSSGGSSGDVNVTVDVDMEETNTLLGSILDGLSGLWEGIVGVFVPDDGAVETFFDDVNDTIQATFSPMSTAEDLLISGFEQLATGTAVGSIQLPAAKMFTVSGGVEVSYNLWSQRNVDLKPYSSKFSALYDTLAAVVDIVCTILVLNMLRNRFEALMVGEVYINAD